MLKGNQMRLAARRFLALAAAAVVAVTCNFTFAAVIVDGTDTLVTTSGSSSFTLSGFDASASDKLVLTVSSEGQGGTKTITGVTYAGMLLHEAVQATHTDGSQTTAIYYVDEPATAGDIVVNWSGTVNGTGIAALALSGTAPGVALSNGSDGTSVALTTTVDDTFAVASFVANSGATGVAAPLTELYAADVGSAGGAAGYRNVPTAGATTFSFTGSSSRPVSVAAGFIEGVTSLESLATQTFENPASGLGFTVTGFDSDISDDTAWAELTDIAGGLPKITFTGAEGSDYFYGQRTDTDTKSITFDAVDLSSISDPRLRISLAANPGVWDSSPDDLLIQLDKNDDGTFETTLADFSAAGGDLALDGTPLGLGFRGFEFFLPDDATNAVLRVDFITSGDSFEAIGIDNVRFIGQRVIPEPSSLVLAALALLNLAFCGRQRRKR